jgi:hypothetical protein
VTFRWRSLAPHLNDGVLVNERIQFKRLIVTQGSEFDASTVNDLIGFRLLCVDVRNGSGRDSEEAKAQISQEYIQKDVYVRTDPRSFVSRHIPHSQATLAYIYDFQAFS